MSFSHDEWRDTRRDLNRGAWYVIRWWLLIVVIALIIGAGIWLLTVALSGPKGQGDGIIQKNSSENWIEKQAFFEDAYANIVAADKSVTIAFEALQGDPEDRVLKTNYTGAQQVCVNMVADYNAEARKFLAEEWRSADLPQQISNIDPDTDCKENVR